MNSGIYQIRNTINNKVYIGSTVNFENRWSDHKHTLKKGKHGNPHLQYSYNKHGIDCFTFSILECCPPFKEILLSTEQKYLDQLKPEYNICKIAGSRQGIKHSEEVRQKISNLGRGRICSEETRKTLSQKLTGKIVSLVTRQKLSNSRIGKKLSEETKTLIAKKNKGRILSEESRKKISDKSLGRTFTKETRNKISLAKTGNFYSEEQKLKSFGKLRKPVLQICPITLKVIKEFTSVKEAAIITNIARASITYVLTNKRKTAGKYIWKLKNNILCPLENMTGL